MGPLPLAGPTVLNVSAYEFPDSRIALLVKAPEPGQVKTRLAPLLGAEGAAAFLDGEIRRLASCLHEAALAPVEVWAGGDAGHAVFRDLAEAYGWRIHRQPDGDLGERMRVAAKFALLDSGSVLLIGADCPQMGAAYLRMALQALENRCGAVIGPAQDGGYVLLGVREVDKALFRGMKWSTPSVLADTRARLRALGWLWQELPTLRDVDTPEDYLALFPPS